MNIVVRYPKEVGEINLAGIAASVRMNEAFSDKSFSVQFLSEDEEPKGLQPDEMILWVEGLFPLLSKNLLSSLVRHVNKQGNTAIFTRGRPGLGLLGLKRAEDLPKNFQFQEWNIQNHPYEPGFDPLFLYPLETTRDRTILNQHFFQTKREELITNGVGFLEPSTVWIDECVHVEAGVWIDANVRISGMSRICSGAHISQGCVITDATINTGAEIKPYSVISESWVGANVDVGPFAHVRPGCHLGDGSRVGNFVETKKTRLGAGSKASHLTYLGNTETGKDCNIGAGTITCNYDGINKSQTVLGDRVFVGSDSKLIAPITLGDDSYVAAGSTISQDVPPNALAISRARQENKEGLAEKLREKARRKAEKNQIS